MPYINDFLLNLPLPVLDNWGYAIIFIVAAAETLPIVGTFVPGQTIIIFGGFLAKLGILNIEAVLSVAIAGAIAGDLLAYFIGRKFGYDFVVRYGKYFYLNAEKYRTTKDLAAEHTGKALIIGRFSPFTRALAAFLAGIYRIKFLKFIFYSVIGSAVWTIISVLIGYAAGHGLEGAAKYLGKMVLWALVLIVLIFLSYRALNKRKQIFVKKHRVYLAFNAASIYVFFKMAEDYFDKGLFYRIDLWIAENIHLIRRDWLDAAMIFISNVLSPEILMFAAMFASAYFFMKKNLYKSSLILISSAGGLASCLAIKNIIGRLRPAGALVEESGFSFPSSHSFAALIFFALIIFIFSKKIKNEILKSAFLAGNLFLIVLTGFSRIYLKAHWFSDVAAGFALGLFWVSFLILAFSVAGKLMSNKR